MFYINFVEKLVIVAKLLVALKDGKAVNFGILLKLLVTSVVIL